MASELNSLTKNQTWEVVKEIEPGRKALGSKWVYKIKRNADGSIACYKARLIVKGYEQCEGIDYDETFVPVAKFVTIRLMLTMAAIHDMETHQIDVVMAFLNRLLLEEEVVYMKAPEGARLPPGTVVVLRRMLYRLKQSPRKWNERLNDFLLSMSFHRSTNDSALYWREEGDKYDYILVYVDDLLIITPTKSDSLATIKEALAKEFDMKDMGELKSFLRIEIT